MGTACHQCGTGATSASGGISAACGTEDGIPPMTMCAQQAFTMPTTKADELFTP